MAFFTESFLNAWREEFLRRICRFQYQLNGNAWENGEINSKQILGANMVAFVNVPSSGKADTITGVRVYDNGGNLVGEQVISLRRSSTDTVLLRFTFPLIEAE